MTDPGRGSACSRSRRELLLDDVRELAQHELDDGERDGGGPRTLVTGVGDLGLVGGLQPVLAGLLEEEVTGCQFGPPCYGPSARPVSA